MSAYTGIGSRRTPREICAYMTKLAAYFAGLGLTLRSGAAVGADSAFESGTLPKQAEIYLPWRWFNGHSSRLPDQSLIAEARAIAATVHPAWDRLQDSARKLHARNAFQVLGPDLRSPSLFVVCWTPDGAEDGWGCSAETGGTGTAIRLAHQHGVPVFNLARSDAHQRLAAFVLACSLR